MSMPKVRFTNRKKEKHHPAPNVVTRPRRPKTSACPVRKRRSLLTVKRLFGEAVDVECLRNKFREGKKKKDCENACFWELFLSLTLSCNFVGIDVAVISYFLSFAEETQVIQGWLILWLFLEHGHMCRSTGPAGHLLKDNQQTVSCCVISALKGNLSEPLSAIVYKNSCNIAKIPAQDAASYFMLFMFDAN